MKTLLPIHGRSARAPAGILGRAGFPAGIQATPASRPAPAFGGLAGKLALACRRGFSLVELIVILLIIIALIGFLAPTLSAWQNSNIKAQSINETMGALQICQTLRNMNRKADADSGFPRLPGVAYTGTALRFAYTDATHPESGGSIAFFNNNQYAQKGTLALNGQIPYDLIPTADPVPIPAGIGIVGVSLVGSAVQLQTIPFAICCGADSFGLPPATSIYADPTGSGNYLQTPTSAAAIVIYRRSDVTKIGADPDNLLTTLPGSSDQQRLNALINKCRGTLVELAPQNGTPVDF